MADEGAASGTRGLRGLLANGLAIAQTRLELLAVEAQEERLRLTELLFNTALAALLLSFGLVFLLLFITVWLWDSHRLLALGLSTTVCLGVGLWAASRAAAAMRRGSRLFSASLAELARDREALMARKASSSADEGRAAP